LKREEVIVCAALRLNGAEEKILLGHRHNEIINEQARFLPTWKKLRRTSSYTQGFFTSRRRFLDRKDAMRVALDTGQVTVGETVSPTDLYSEDVW
jgi:hypothetical protein